MSVQKPQKRNLVIVVNYNQEQEARSFAEKLSQIHPVEETIVVDDGSVDGSPEIFQSLGYSVVRHPLNRGIGAAIRTGIDHALSMGSRYYCVTIMSSNGKMQPTEVPRLANLVLQGKADYAQGSRFIDDGLSSKLPQYRRWAIPALTWLANTLFKGKNTDITCGFRCYRLDFLRLPQLKLYQEWLDRYELEYYIHYWALRTRQRMVEVPVTIRYDHLSPRRRSKIRPIIGWWSILKPFVLLPLGLKR